MEGNKLEITSKRKYFVYPTKKLARKINSRLIKTAEYLTTVTEKISKRGKIFTLFIFCGMSSTLSIFIIINALRNENHGFSIEKIIIPAHVPGTNQNDSFRKFQQLPGPEYNNIIDFKNYLDSLEQTPVGKNIYDSFVKARPGLIDSIRILHRVYQ
ncbi:MAG: hypothetical protein V4717_14440 [Bacteroidota bacterium]